MQLLETLCTAVDRRWKSLHWSCGLKACDSRLFMRSIPQHRVGIRMAETWYCSVDCLVRATRTQLAAVVAERSIEMPHKPRLPIGTILLSKKWLTRGELDTASVKSLRTGVDLEATFLQMGLVDERQLTCARAVQWGYPVMRTERAIRSLETDLPLGLMSAFAGVPLHYAASTRRLLVGFVYRVEHSLLRAIEQATACKVEPCFVTPTEFQHQMKRLEVVRECTEVLLDLHFTPSEVANKVGCFALEVKAREITFERCREFVWMRISGRRRKVDVLFRYRQSEIAPSRAILAGSTEDVRAFG